MQFEAICRRRYCREFHGLYMLMHGHLMWRFRGEPAIEDEIADTRR